MLTKLSSTEVLYKVGMLFIPDTVHLHTQNWNIEFLTQSYFNLTNGTETSFYYDSIWDLCLFKINISLIEVHSPDSLTYFACAFARLGK